MANIITHQGVVEKVNGSRLQVRIIQASACASCSAKGHCFSADAKEKIIDVIQPETLSCQVGDRVWVVGALSTGTKAVLFAFILPFLILVFSLFIFMVVWSNEVVAALCSLLLLVPYYYIVWLNRSRLSRMLSFSIRPMDN